MKARKTLKIIGRIFLILLALLVLALLTTSLLYHIKLHKTKKI